MQAFACTVARNWRWDCPQLSAEDGPSVYFQMQAFACTVARNWRWDCPQLSAEDGPSLVYAVDSTMPREGMEEEACEVSAEFSCEEVVEEEASIGMN